MSSNTTNNYKGPYAIEPPSFKVDPVYLSTEHAKQVERFQGYPYDAEQDARQKGYSAFKEWHHRLQVVADLKSDDPQSDKIGTLEDYVLEEGEDVFSLHWDASDPYVAYCAGMVPPITIEGRVAPLDHSPVYTMHSSGVNCSLSVR